MQRRQRPHALTAAEAQRLYCLKLREAQAWLTVQGVEYRMLGSVPTSAFVDPPGNTALDFVRPGARGPYQRMPDIDMVVPMADYLRVKEYRDQLERDPDFPIGIEILPSVCHFDFLPGEEVSYITHRALRTPFPTRLFDAVTVEFLGEPIVTVDPRTLFHTYVTLGGMLRPKDVPRALALARAIRDNGISKLDEPDLRPFHEFLADRMRRYPSYQRYRVIANWVRYRVPDPVHHWGVYYGRLLQPVFFGNAGRPR